MPPTFPYIIALMVYFAVAGVVWTVALFLSLEPSMRPLAKRLAAGMAGSFPGVFLFQLLCVPVLALVFLLLHGLALVGRPPALILVAIALFVISIPVAASLRGFYVGWRVAWEWAAGRSPRAFVASDWLLGPILRRFL